MVWAIQCALNLDALVPSQAPKGKNRLGIAEELRYLALVLGEASAELGGL